MRKPAIPAKGSYRREQILAAIDGGLERIRTPLRFVDLLANQDKMLGEFGLEVPPHALVRYDECAHILKNRLLSVQQALHWMQEACDELLDCYRGPDEPGWARTERTANWAVGLTEAKISAQLRRIMQALGESDNSLTETRDCPLDISSVPEGSVDQTSQVPSLSPPPRQGDWHTPWDPSGV